MVYFRLQSYFQIFIKFLANPKLVSVNHPCATTTTQCGIQKSYSKVQTSDHTKSFPKFSALTLKRSGQDTGYEARMKKILNYRLCLHQYYSSKDLYTQSKFIINYLVQSVEVIGNSPMRQAFHTISPSQNIPKSE